MVVLFEGAKAFFFFKNANEKNSLVNPGLKKVQNILN